MKQNKRKYFTILLSVWAVSLCAEKHITSFDYAKYNAEWKKSYEKIPLLNMDSLQAHPLRNTIKVKSASSCELMTPPIGNQGNLNSCLGWAFGYAATSIRLYAEWGDMDSALCSPSFLFNQCKEITDSSDCTTAYSTLNSVIDTLSNCGVCSYSMMPYDSTDCMTQPTVEQRVDALNKIFHPVKRDIANSTSIYKSIIDLGYPIVVGMPMYTSFREMWNDSEAHGLWNYVDTTEYEEGLWHATCIVGYDDSKNAFKVMNSWGTDGGDSGFYWANYNIVAEGCFQTAVVLFQRDSLQIEGPTILSDSAWYYVRNVPEGATITWSINNNPTNPDIFEFVLVSAQNKDSIKVAYQQKSINPRPGFEHSIGDNIDGVERYRTADLTVTVSSGTNSYSITKRVKRQINSTIPFLSRSKNIVGNNLNVDILNEVDSQLIEGVNVYTIELWDSAYGLMRTCIVDNTDAPLDTHGLPQGLYIQILKDHNGTIINRTKIMIH